jgi:hypothetical protein
MSDPAAVHCTDHPERELVRALILSAPVSVQADQRSCPDDRHGWRDRHRCAHCGGPMERRGQYRSVYCSTRHRVAALRARRRVTPQDPFGPVTPQPGPNAEAIQAPAETAQENQA